LSYLLMGQVKKVTDNKIQYSKNFNYNYKTEGYWEEGGLNETNLTQKF